MNSHRNRNRRSFPAPARQLPFNSFKPIDLRTQPAPSGAIIADYQRAVKVDENEKCKKRRQLMTVGLIALIFFM